MRDDVQQHNDDSGYLSEGIITPRKKQAAPLVLSTERKNKLKRRCGFRNNFSTTLRAYRMFLMLDEVLCETLERLFSLPEEDCEDALFPCDTPAKILKMESLPQASPLSNSKETPKGDLQKTPAKELPKERTLADDLETVTKVFKKLREAQSKKRSINRLSDCPLRSPMKFTKLRPFLVELNNQIVSIISRMLKEEKYGSALEFCLASWTLAEKIPREWNDEIMEEIACKPMDSIVDSLAKITKETVLSEESLVRLKKLPKYKYYIAETLSL